jgi:hypothetical protein
MRLAHVQNLCGTELYPVRPEPFASVRPERSGAKSKDAQNRLRVSAVEG